MRDRNKQAGFTLVEMAVVILIAGLITGAVFAFYTPYMETKRREITIERENKIARALTDFAQRTGRLPCPAHPNPTASIALGTPMTSCNIILSSSMNATDGIVPFRALGLSQADALDGYDNPFTYAASPALTSSVETTAHNNCRTNIWNPSGTDSLNEAKAILCCQMDDTDPLMRMAVYDQLPPFPSDEHITPIQGDDGTTLSGTFANPDTGGATPNTDTLAYFAYVIISHGKNGEGAYVFGRSNRRAFINVGNGERQNANNSVPTASSNDLSYTVLEYRTGTPGANDYFDDIVLWRTQQGLIRELGNDSCSRP